MIRVLETVNGVIGFSMHPDGGRARTIEQYRDRYEEAQTRLRHAVESCMWQDIDPPASQRLFHVWAFRGPTGSVPHPGAAGTKVKRCVAPALTASDDLAAHWHVMHIGPFVTDGNGTRVELLYRGVYKAMGLQTGDEIAESEAGPRWAEDGSVAHLPAFHVHHFLEVTPDGRHEAFVDRLRARHTRYEPVASDACDPLQFYSSTMQGPAGFVAGWQCSQTMGCNNQWAHQIIPQPYAYVFEPREVDEMAASFILEDMRTAPSVSRDLAALPRAREWCVERALNRQAHTHLSRAYRSNLHYPIVSPPSSQRSASLTRHRYVELALLKYDRRTGRAPAIRPAFGQVPCLSLNVWMPRLVCVSVCTPSSCMHDIRPSHQAVPRPPYARAALALPSPASS